MFLEKGNCKTRGQPKIRYLAVTIILNTHYTVYSTSQTQHVILLRRLRGTFMIQRQQYRKIYYEQ